MSTHYKFDLFQTWIKNLWILFRVIIQIFYWKYLHTNVIVINKNWLIKYDKLKYNISIIN